MSLYIFDKDGTLIQCQHKRWFLPLPPLRCEDQVLLPGVFEKLAELRAAGHRLALASNQQAVAKGVLPLSTAQALLENCAAKVGGVDAWRVSPFDPRAKRRRHGQPNPYAQDDPSHKPHPGMLLDLMAELGFDAADTIVVGNAAADRKAARAAGVRYISARKFFRF